jgi:hypothetical protein
MRARPDINYYTARDPRPYAHASPLDAPALDLSAAGLPNLDPSLGKVMIQQSQDARLVYATALEQCRAALEAHTGEAVEMSGDVATDVDRLGASLRRHIDHTEPDAAGHPAKDVDAFRLLYPMNVAHERRSAAIRALADAISHHLGHRVRLES